MRGSNLRETLAELGLLEVWDEIRNPSCHEPPTGGRDSNTAHSPRPKTTEEEGGKQKDTKTGVVGRYLDEGGIPPTLTPDRETR